jgi:hypothetical protein
MGSKYKKRGRLSFVGGPRISPWRTLRYSAHAVPEVTKQELLRKAIQRIGLTEVALALKSPPELVSAWMSGHASMPDRKLLMLADFLDNLGRPEKG